MEATAGIHSSRRPEQIRKTNGTTEATGKFKMKAIKAEAKRAKRNAEAEQAVALENELEQKRKEIRQLEKETVTNPLMEQFDEEGLGSKGWKSELELPIDTDTGTKIKCDVYLKHPTKHRHVYIECKLLTENGFSHALGQVLRYAYMHVATLGAAQISTVKIIALNKEPSAEQQRVAKEYDVWCWWPGQRLSTRLGEDEAQPTVPAS